MPKPTIDGLLAARHTRRIGQPGSPARAHARLRLNRVLWRDYEAFAELRGKLAGRQIRFGRMHPAGRRMVRRLEDAGIIIDRGDHHAYRSLQTKRYVTGGWLEELAYCAMLEAGAEEAYYAQKVAWSLDGVRGSNEIDVIARRGPVLSFVSCKTASPFLRNGRPRDRRARARIENQIFETHYWDQHFSNGAGRAVLMITTDLVDEMRARDRSSTLFARAKVLDVDLVGRDFFDWNKLTSALAEHW